MRKLTVYSLVFVIAVSFAMPAALAQRRDGKAKATSAAALAAARGVDTIAAPQLRDYLSFIASDEMEGRDTPSRGLDTTAKFMAMNLDRWGFKPAGDDGTFFQHIALRRAQVDAAQTHVEFNGQTLSAGEDYVPTSTSGNASDQLVFAGNGWLIKAKNIDAYKDIDAKGKIAIIFSAPNSLPRGLRRADLSGAQGEDWMSATDYARKQGVVAIVYVPDFQFLANWDRNRQRIIERGTTVVEKFQAQGGAQLPSIVASPKLANALFQGEKQSATAIFEAVYSGGTIPPSFALNPEKRLSINLGTKADTLTTQNIVAVWPGSDPVLKNEYVALGAHYDHIGICAPGAADPICNGADDDGSGTTALLGMAEAISHAKERPRRSVLFVWHCGEEKGLWGSQYFTEYPTIPLNQIVTQLNIDMIGRSRKEGDTNPRNRELSGPNQIYVIGSKMMSTELGELSESVNKSFLNLEYDYRYDDSRDPNRFFFRSDHFNYARKGIPIIFFFDGVHEDYHQPGDEPQKIDYQKMEKVTRTIYMILWELANRPARPKVDKQLPPELMRRG